MRPRKAISTAVLLLPMSAAAQQGAEPQPSAQSSAPDAAQSAQPSQQAAPATAQPVPAQASQPAQASAPQPAPVAAQAAAIPQPAAAPAPTTMDQVVNLFIEREHGLIKMLATRTPVVETYLQNLTADTQLGPVPSADHYFLVRMDMAESVDRKHSLQEQA